MDKLICELCGYVAKNRISFSVHFRKRHTRSIKEYYDTYFKTEGEDICPSCGKMNKFRDMWYGYNKHCSKLCIPKDEKIQEKMKDTCMKKYGVEYAWKAESTKENIKKTCLERYGVEYCMQNKEIHNKAEETCLEKYGAKNVLISDYGREKAKETSLEKWGVEYSAQAEEVKDKIKKSHLEKYGVDNPGKSREFRLKATETRKKNGNRSKLEIYLEQSLIENNITYEIEYNSDERYPFHCDFYIPEKDLFIEIHGHWSHGGHFFNPNNETDLKLLSLWEEKGKRHEQYVRSIKTWTELDVKKKESAENHNLNYVVLWNKNDIDKWIESGFEIRKDYKN